MLYKNRMRISLLYSVCMSITCFQVMRANIIGSNTAVSREGAAFLPADATDNELRGFALFENGFTLENSLTSCLWNAVFPVSGEILLNGGTLTLARNLAFQHVTLNSVGEIIGGGYTIKFTDETVTKLPAGLTTIFVAEDEETAGGEPNSVDWAYDSGYIAVGTEADTIEAYSFNGSTLSLQDTIDVKAPVYCVRWHPSAYYVAASRGSGVDEARIYSFDTGSGTLTEADTADFDNRAVHALGWDSTGVHIGIAADHRNSQNTALIRIYEFSGGTFLGASYQYVFGVNDILFSDNALSWDRNNAYIAVGLRGGSPELQVFNFTGGAVNLNAQSTIGAAVSAVDWSPKSDLVAVGLAGTTERLRIYQHDSGAGSLTELTSARVGEARTVYSLQWSPDDSSLLVGTASGIGSELSIYTFDGSSLALIQEVSSFADVFSTRRSPNQEYVAKVASDDSVIIYTTAQSDQFIFSDCSLVFSSDVVLTRESIFKGSCVIDAGSNVITLQDKGSLKIDSEGSLLIKNGILKNINGNNIACSDSSATFSLSHMELFLDADYSFTQGALDVLGDVVLSGTHIFSYETDQVGTIYAQSRLTVGQGGALKYAPSVARSDLIVFEDNSSELYLQSASLISTETGLQLTKGTLIFDGTCPIISDAVIQENGITFGDGSSVFNNLSVKPLAESGFDVQQGFVVNKNV